MAANPEAKEQAERDAGQFELAQGLDAADPLRPFRDEFHSPLTASEPQRSFPANSLGRHTRPPTFKASTIKTTQQLPVPAARPLVAAAATAANGTARPAAAAAMLPTISNPLVLGELSALFVPISATDATGLACSGTSFSFVSVDEVKVRARILAPVALSGRAAAPTIPGFAASGPTALESAWALDTPDRHLECLPAWKLHYHQCCRTRPALLLR